jgi:hypothetical protein
MLQFEHICNKCKKTILAGSVCSDHERVEMLFRLTCKPVDMKFEQVWGPDEFVGTRGTAEFICMLKMNAAICKSAGEIIRRDIAQNWQESFNYAMLMSIENPSIRRTTHPGVRFNYRIIENSLPEPDIGMYTALQMFDQYAIQRATGKWYSLKYLRERIFHRVATEKFVIDGWDNVVIKDVSTIEECALRRLSAYNTICGHDIYSKYTRSATEGLKDGKFALAFTKFARDTYTPVPARCGADLKTGLDLLYGSFATHRMFETFVWQFTDQHIWEMKLPGQGSAGFTNFAQLFYHVFGLDLQNKKHCSKAEAEYAMKKFLIQALAAMRADPSLSAYDALGQVVTTVTTKFEVFNKFTKGAYTPGISPGVVDQAGMGFPYKVRFFNITQILVYMVNLLVDAFRHHVELEGIMIGLCWEKGGADWFVRYHNLPQAVYVAEADVDGLDVSIKLPFLAIYKSFSLAYVKKSISDIGLWKRLHAWLVSNLCVKLVPISDNDWAWFMGKMPSGDWDTSHGDSWIMRLFWCMFMAYQCKKFPLLADQIKADWIVRRICFPVYGDDHIIVICSSSLVPILNMKEFSKYLLEVLDIKLRDAREYFGVGAWMCIPDSGFTGRMKRTGVKFLQRQFYYYKEWDQYVCVRDSTSVMHKLLFNNNRTDYLDVAAGALGIAFDSMGTNTFIYEFARFMYAYVSSVFVKTDPMQYDNQVFLHLMTNKNFSNKLRQRLGINFKTILPGFPTQESLFERQKGKYEFKAPYLGNFYEYDEDDIFSFSGMDD